MHTIYLVIPIIVFKFQKRFDVRSTFVATVLFVLFNIIGHVALYADFTILCGVGMWAISELDLIASFTVKQILLVALVVFAIYEIINTAVDSSRK